MASTAAAVLAVSRGDAKPIEATGDAKKQRLVSAEWFVYDTGRMRPNYWRPEQKDRVYGLALRLKTDAGAEGAWGATIYNVQTLAAMPESICRYQECGDADPVRSLQNAGKRTVRTMAAFSFSAYEPDAQGRVRFPEEAGTGISVDWQFIANHAWKPEPV